MQLLKGSIQHPKKDYYIASEIEAIDITQLRDEIRSNYPLLDAIADKIQTMDARETLRYTIISIIELWKSLIEKVPPIIRAIKLGAVFGFT